MSESFKSETGKIRAKIAKYYEGKSVIDIGCGTVEKLTPDAYGIDTVYGMANLVINPADIYNLHMASMIQPADVVFSSHCLEHLCDTDRAMESWMSLVKPGGYLILYLPDGDYYNNRENVFHCHDWRYARFVEEAAPWAFHHFGKVVESGLDVGEGRYSFYVVIQKEA